MSSPSHRILPLIPFCGARGIPRGTALFPIKNRKVSASRVRLSYDRSGPTGLRINRCDFRTTRRMSGAVSIATQGGIGTSDEVEVVSLYCTTIMGRSAGDASSLESIRRAVPASDSSPRKIQPKFELGKFNQLCTSATRPAVEARVFAPDPMRFVALGFGRKSPPGVAHGMVEKNRWVQVESPINAAAPAPDRSPAFEAASPQSAETRCRDAGSG